MNRRPLEAISSATAAFAFLSACTRTSSPPTPVPSSELTPRPAPSIAATGSLAATPRDFNADLQAIAGNYTAMSRADGTWWAPENCRAPTHPAFLSQADSGPHGRKIYTLFVDDFAAYAPLSGARVPPGPSLSRPVAKLQGVTQIVVKEAWRPVKAAKFASECASQRGPSFLADVTMDGTAYRACDRAGLFVMYRTAEAGPDTDDGWVYGTLTDATRAGETPSGYGVTSAGRVASCMSCHERAPHGRLFGLRSDKKN